MEVLWLKSQKTPHQKICPLARISPNTLLTYLRDDQEGRSAISAEPRNRKIKKSTYIALKVN
jgi:hypothetical protein